MYESFFGFSHRPFAAAPSAKCYFPGQAAEAARQTLARVIDRAEGVGLLTGPAGTGKSLLCQVLAEQFRRSHQVALLASGQLCTRRALLQSILFELGLPFRGLEEGDLRLSIVDHLSPRGRLAVVPNTAPAQTPAVAQSPLLLIVDEAHTLPLRLLEELRLITNLVRNGQPQVRLVLAGSPQLEERFASPKLESFNQRVAARCYLEAFDRQQTVEYVRYQIEQAECQPDAIFTTDALEAVAQATDGIPRLVNQLCDHVLLLAYAGGERQITPAGIEEAWADLQQLPTPWNAAAGAPATETSETDVIEFGSLDDPLTDELPVAVPFRSPASAQTPQTAESESSETSPEISAELTETAEERFHTIPAFTTEVELAFPETVNPFQESFDHEEVVIDRYTSYQSDALANRPLVRSNESRQLSALLEAAGAPSTKPTMAVAPQTWPGGVPVSVPASPTSPTPTPAPSPVDLDNDLIVIEEPSVTKTIEVARPVARVRRLEYRQLFAQLRRG